MLFYTSEIINYSERLHPPCHFAANSLPAFSISLVQHFPEICFHPPNVLREYKDRTAHTSHKSVSPLPHSLRNRARRVQRQQLYFCTSISLFLPSNIWHRYQDRRKGLDCTHFPEICHSGAIHWDMECDISKYLHQSSIKSSGFRYL